MKKLILLFLSIIYFFISCKQLVYNENTYLPDAKKRGLYKECVKVIYIEDVDKHLIYEVLQDGVLRWGLYSVKDSSSVVYYENYLDRINTTLSLESLLMKNTEFENLEIEVLVKDKQGVYRSQSRFFDIIVNDELELLDFYFNKALDERHNDSIKKIEIRLKNRGIPAIYVDSTTNFYRFNYLRYVFESDLPKLTDMNFKLGGYSWEGRLTFVDYAVINDSINNDDTLKVIKSIDPFEPKYYNYSDSKRLSKKESRMYRKIAKKIDALISEQ